MIRSRKMGESWECSLQGSAILVLIRGPGQDGAGSQLFLLLDQKPGDGMGTARRPVKAPETRMSRRCLADCAKLIEDKAP